MKAAGNAEFGSRRCRSQRRSDVRCAGSGLRQKTPIPVRISPVRMEDVLDGIGRGQFTHHLPLGIDQGQIFAAGRQAKVRCNTCAIAGPDIQPRPTREEITARNVCRGKQPFLRIGCVVVKAHPPRKLPHSPIVQFDPSFFRRTDAIPRCRFAAVGHGSWVPQKTRTISVG